ncbi:DUF6351 family protein [Aeromicrobium choanae]|uniref:DUF6351 domain-containing protein n=1 Tax=Aeromicrobium choanae TaxID=1736691 RepID=A0A1T4Z685_9ACTN|nr:DUF6351 family protein [Aeromicrobium choanae]SKB09065.1 hypothetical protein SAMN06295964_2469 [Aeromicrobium choanae]
MRHHQRRPLRLVLLVGTAGLALVAGATVAAEAGSPRHGSSLRIEVLSSAPHQVSAGDALVEVTVPRQVRPADVVIRAGATNVTDAFAVTTDRTLVGLVGDLRTGRTTLRAEVRRGARSGARAASLTVTNHPASGPMFSGPQQQPFVCTTARGRFDGRKILGQPIVDNQDRQGIAVAREDANGDYPQDGRGYPTAAAETVGWSANCAAERRIGYVYRSTTDDRFHWLDDPANPPSDIATTTTKAGRTVPYVVRWERGTVNRFVYSIAALAPVGEADPERPDASLWNRRLVFSFQGGVAIGHTQGTTSDSAMLPADLLGQGYGVMWSSGTRTSTHYNLQLGGETALMLKERAIETYGVPDYTVAVGGSGGAIQQYVYAQNHPGIIDAAIPQYSYPDMVTQVIHVGDCELLEYYFDATDRTNAKWRDPEVRQAIIGLNGTKEPKNLSAGEIAQWNQLYGAMQALGYQVMDRAPGSAAPPLMECKPGWFGLTPLALNPTFTDVDDLDQLAQGTEGVQWTHFADLVNIYGTGPDGYARVPWDNVGVQYGLEAMKDGVITPAEFLDLNAKVGSWKESRDMVPEGAPFDGPTTPQNFDPWSSRNMNLSPDGTTPAPRREGDLKAIRAAYSSGMQFQGDIDIPIIDLRPYLEDELDMHNTQQSFASRQRMLNVDGDASNQVVWFADARPAQDYDPTLRAFEVVDEWMANIAKNPRRGVSGNKPARAVDTCFTTSGDVIAAGPRVWSGIIDSRAAGECTQRFPIYSSSRRVAGGPYEGGIWKCALQPVSKAARSGLYGSWRPSRAELARLEQVFPDGVCDYRKPDVGKPRHHGGWGKGRG